VVRASPGEALMARQLKYIATSATANGYRRVAGNNAEASWKKMLDEVEAAARRVAAINKAQREAARQSKPGSAEDA